MRAGDIVFESGTTPISKIIKWLDGGEFSHVGICVSDSGHLLESQYGVDTRITPFYFKDYEVVDLGLTDEERDKVVHLGIQLVGRHYDYLQIFGYLAKYLFGLKDIRKFNSPNNLICSELIDFILYSLGKVPVDIYLGGRTPNELYRFLKYDYKKLNGESVELPYSF